MSAKTDLSLDLVMAALKEAVRDCLYRRPPPPIGWAGPEFETAYANCWPKTKRSRQRGVGIGCWNAPSSTAFVRRKVGSATTKPCSISCITTASSFTGLGSSAAAPGAYQERMGGRRNRNRPRHDPVSGLG